MKDMMQTDEDVGRIDTDVPAVMCTFNAVPFD